MKEIKPTNFPLTCAKQKYQLLLILGVQTAEYICFVVESAEEINAVADYTEYINVFI